MRIDEKDKINILLNLLTERYNASHRMRERSLNFALWILGFGVAIAWLLLSGVSLTIFQKVVLTIFVIVVSTLATYFLHSIKKGFDNNKELIIDIEQALGCYEEGVYINSKSLFPEEYRENIEELPGFRKVLRLLGFHFVSIYIWIIGITSMIILLIWFGPN